MDSSHSNVKSSSTGGSHTQALTRVSSHALLGLSTPNRTCIHAHSRTQTATQTCTATKPIQTRSHRDKRRHTHNSIQPQPHTHTQTHSCKHTTTVDSPYTNLERSSLSCASMLSNPDVRTMPVKTWASLRWRSGKQLSGQTRTCPDGRVRAGSKPHALRCSISSRMSSVLATLSNRLRRLSTISSCASSAAAELAARFSAALRSICLFLCSCTRRP